MYIKNIFKISALKGLIKNLFTDRNQKIIAVAITVIIAFFVLETGASPKRYSLKEGDKSSYDIYAPRDIINRTLADQKAKEAENAVSPVLKPIESVTVDVWNNMDEFFTLFENARKDISKNLENQGITSHKSNYKKQLEIEQDMAATNLEKNIKKYDIPLSNAQVQYLISKPTDDELSNFKKIMKDIVIDIMKSDITESNLANVILTAQGSLQEKNISQDLKNIGSMTLQAMLKPNREIDKIATDLQKEQAYKKAYEDSTRIDLIKKGDKIIGKGEKVTLEKLQLLEGANMLKKNSKTKLLFDLSMWGIVVFLFILMYIFIKYLNKKTFKNKNDLMLLCSIISVTLLASIPVYDFNIYLIPVMVATMWLSILVDIKLAFVTNLVISTALLLIAKGDLSFIFMSIIGGTISAFLVSKAEQRSKLTLMGLLLGVINALVVLFISIIFSLNSDNLLSNCLYAFLNGIGSVIIVTGTLPLWESIFNIISPMKLLELANPNQKILKRLLLEAPGTYHHSLMVGNLAEMATEEIGGNALLARVGAYFHDIGKLKRPNFFMENQMSENPHDKMTANLSTLVITSHTEDGVALAQKYKIPTPVRDIIAQHHGTTLVAYFYHKARTTEKSDSISADQYRYSGPKPNTKEAAVVMLADSVEAAVRSMVDKTEGKIEGLVRKIIKDKLDDGQLDHCDLTLKDLDTIARAFMKAFGGLFHEREEYPDLKELKHNNKEDKAAENSEIDKDALGTINQKESL